MLHNIVGKNSYCGLAAISTLTGMITDQAATLIRKHSGQTRIRHTWPSFIIRALRDVGLVATEWSTSAATLNQFMKLRLRNMERPYLVVLTNHFAVVRGNHFADCRVRMPTNWFIDTPHKCRHFELAYEITGEVDPSCFPPKGRYNPFYHKFRALVKTAPDIIYRSDMGYRGWIEIEDGHTFWRKCHDWKDALSKLQNYLQQHPEAVKVTSTINRGG